LFCTEYFVGVLCGCGWLKVAVAESNKNVLWDIAENGSRYDVIV
jgi:hypothetical protein